MFLSGAMAGQGRSRTRDERFVLLAERLLALLPLDRAALAGLQRLEDAQGLADGPADLGVVIQRVLHDAVGVDDEGRAGREAALLDERAVAAGDLAVHVRHQRIAKLAERAVDPRL